MKQISLRAARVNAGLTLVEASKAIGISKYTISKYENGDAVPRWDVFCKFCKLYDCTPDFIFLPKQ